MPARTVSSHIERVLTAGVEIGVVPCPVKNSRMRILRQRYQPRLRPSASEPATISAEPAKVKNVGTSPKNVKPMIAAQTSAVYSVGASREAFAREKAKVSTR